MDSNDGYELSGSPKMGLPVRVDRIPGHATGATSPYAIMLGGKGKNRRLQHHWRIMIPVSIACCFHFFSLNFYQPGRQLDLQIELYIAKGASCVGMEKPFLVGRRPVLYGNNPV